MKLTYPLLVLIAIWGFPQHTISQNCEAVFEGKVTDFHDGHPLENALIRLYHTDKAAVSDIDGNFSISGICPGSYEVEISHESCTPRFMTLEITGITTRRITLEHHLEELREVVVEGTRDHPVTASATEQILHTETIDKFSAASVGDALKEISGVSSLNTGSAIVKPVIQGLHSSRIITMNNGVRLQDQEWGMEHAPNLDLNAAGSLTVVKGAAALQYGGDAIGGVIIAEPSKIPVKDTLYGKTILSGATNGRGGALISSLTKSYETGWHWQAQGTLKRFGDFKAPGYSLTNTGYSQQAFSAGFGLNKFTHGFEAYYSFYRNEIGILRSSHIGSQRDLLQAINNREPLVVEDFSYDINAPKQQVTHHLAKINFFKRFEQLGKWNLQYDFQQNNRQEYDLRRGERKGTPSMDMKLTTHTLTSGFLFDARGGRTINTGILLRYQHNVPDPETGVRRLIPDYDRYDAGLYASIKQAINESLVVDAGIRYDFNRMDAEKFYKKDRWEDQGYDEDFGDIITEDYGDQWLTNPTLDFHSISATAGLEYQLGSSTLRLNYALANRPPNPAELFSDGLHHSAAAIELGDLRIDQETSHKISASYALKTRKLSLSIAPYLNMIGDYILLEPSGSELNIRGAFPVWRYRQVDALFAGADLDLNYDISEHWSFNHKFAYVHARDRSRNRALIAIPPANTTNKITYLKPEWHQLTLSLRSDYFFRQNEFPDNNFTISVIEDGEYVDRTADISTPPDAYHLLGFDASATFPLRKRSELTVGVTVNNILDTKYRDYLNRLRFFSDDLGRNMQLSIKMNY
ncbi:TonB-dependent receptor [Sinomicrobium soli]|uniref:TonB-dependent receptor n=1 Tax=Sinomicrobium sp. N-1-3-6 TaxID=2219864 RepID=UPI000DCCF0E9|nr:TonB-dependent receptor [Sinomicrobium sp. N-1-3-6]RAV28568.1 TonB-dependent receptor [Sinomicrobium sp. N-1-3-6]